MGTLRVLAAGEALVQDFAAMRSGIRRFIGRKIDPNQGEEFVDEEDPTIKRRQAVFVPTDAPELVQDCPEYRKALMAGDLLPADEATAKAVGLAWKAAPKPAVKE